MRNNFKNSVSTIVINSKNKLKEKSGTMIETIVIIAVILGLLAFVVTPWIKDTVTDTTTSADGYVDTITGIAGSK